MEIDRIRLGYRPFGAQVRAHRSPSDVVFFSGGWGSGKTYWLVAEALRNAARNPGLPGAMVSPTFPLQRRTLFRTIVDLFPRATRWPEGRDTGPSALGPLVKSWSARDRCLRLWNDAEIFFVSAEDPGSMEGANYAWACLDEPRLVTHEAFRILNARVRHPASAKHRVSVAGVPALGWLYEEFGKPGPNRHMIRASTAENPHLPPGYIERLNLSERLARAYLHGEFVVLEGAVYFTYDLDSIVDVEPDPNRPTFGFLDFGGRRPYFGISQDVEGLGEVVVEEIVAADVLESRHARDCAELVKSLGLTMLDCYCDPAGRARNAQTGLSSFKVYEDAFLSAGVLSGRMLSPRGPIERHIPNGVEAVRARFQAHDGTRRLFVARRLTSSERTGRYPRGVLGIHHSLQGYRYPANRPNSNVPEKTGVEDHAMDALRYLIVGRYGVIEAPDILAMNALVPSRPSVGYSQGGLSMEDF